MQKWKLLGNSSPDDLVRHQRTFPDGTDVILAIRHVDGTYEVTSTAESRTSGPSVASLGRVVTLAEATRQLEEEAAAWERDLS